MNTEPRPYRQTARARAAEETGTRILQACMSLWRERGLEGMTLQAIADRAAVTVQTVIRRFGSREGVVSAAIEARASGIEAARDKAPVGDIDEALNVLLTHYERDGAQVLATMEAAPAVEAARRIVAHGAAFHRDWCERVFAPWLPLDEGVRQRRLDALVLATDIRAWALLRRELERGPAKARAVLRESLIAMTEAWAP